MSASSCLPWLLDRRDLPWFAQDKSSTHDRLCRILSWVVKIIWPYVPFTWRSSLEMLKGRKTCWRSTRNVEDLLINIMIYGEVKGSRCCSGGFFNMFQYWLLSLPWMGKLADLSFGDDIFHPSFFFRMVYTFFVCHIVSKQIQYHPISNTKKIRRMLWSKDSKTSQVFLLEPFQQRWSSPPSSRRLRTPWRSSEIWTKILGNLAPCRWVSPVGLREYWGTKANLYLDRSNVPIQNVHVSGKWSSLVCKQKWG